MAPPTKLQTLEEENRQLEAQLLASQERATMLQETIDNLKVTNTTAVENINALSEQLAKSNSLLSHAQDQLGKINRECGRLQGYIDRVREIDDAARETGQETITHRRGSNGLNHPARQAFAMQTQNQAEPASF